MYGHLTAVNCSVLLLQDMQSGYPNSPSGASGASSDTFAHLSIHSQPETGAELKSQLRTITCCSVLPRELSAYGPKWGVYGGMHAARARAGQYMACTQQLSSAQVAVHDSALPQALQGMTWQT